MSDRSAGRGAVDQVAARGGTDRWLWRRDRGPTSPSFLYTAGDEKVARHAVNRMDAPEEEKVLV